MGRRFDPDRAHVNRFKRVRAGVLALSRVIRTLEYSIEQQNEANLEKI